MRSLHCVLVLLAAMVFGGSFVLLPEDLPETPYDESETLPYDDTPVLSSVLLDLAKSNEFMASMNTSLGLDLEAIHGRIRVECGKAAVDPNVDSLTILDHCLRC